MNEVDLSYFSLEIYPQHNYIFSNLSFFKMQQK